MTVTLAHMATPRDTSARIRAEIAAQGKTYSAVREAAGIPRGRWYSHMSQPHLWRTDELRAIARVLSVGIAELAGEEAER